MTDDENRSDERTTGDDRTTEGAGATEGAGVGDEVREALAELRGEVQWLRGELSRLDADLDESRLLNLRAAELLDIVFERLGRPGQRVPTDG